MENLNALIDPIDIFELPMQDQLLDTDEIEKSNIDEGHDGLSPVDANLLYELETNPTPSDSWWWQWQERLVELAKDGLVAFQDRVSYGAGGTVRNAHLTPKGRLMMLVGRMQSGGTPGAI